MHLSGHAGLLRAGHRILVVAPHEATLRALRRCVGIHVTSVDVTARPGIDVRATANRLPFDSAVFDVVVSVHVLEHLDDDMTAIREMARVLSPTGRAIVNVPCDWNETTIEDATVTSPGERRRLFGEADHRRLYGRDLVDRLQAGGFATEVSLGDRVPHGEVERFGLSRAEHVFECRLTDLEARRR
jgi:SAM-dependent methyltransferase